MSLVRVVRRAAGPEAGQSAVEYVGLTTVVLVLVLAIAQVEVGERLVAAMGGELCSALLSAPCSGSAADVAAERLAALDPCPLRSAEAGGALNAAVLSLRAGSVDRAIVEQYSDGTISVTFSDREELGAELGVGAGVSVKGAPGARGGGLRAEAGAGVVVATGKAYEFDDPRAAARFLERYGGAETMGGEAVNRVVAGCPACRELGVRPTALPPPDVTFLEGGAGARARADADFGLGGAGAQAVAEAMVGRRIDHRTGRETLYFRMNGGGSGSAAATLGIARAEGAVAHGREALVALTRAADGTPLELTVGSTHRYSDALEASLALQGAVGSTAPGTSGSISADSQKGDVVHYEAVLDLRDDVLSREAALRFVSALAPLTDPAELLDSAGALGDRIDAVGELNVRNLQSSRDAVGLEGAGALAVKVGGGFDRVEGATTLVAAYTRPAGASEYVDRTDCLGGGS